MTECWRSWASCFSPLSWWNDLFVNVPLALLFACWPAFSINRLFGACAVLGYWLTNILGFILLHKGAEHMLSKENRKYSRRDLLRDVGVSLLYTVLIVGLIKLGC